MRGKEDTRTGEGLEAAFKSVWNVVCHGNEGLKQTGKVNTEKWPVVHGSLLSYSPLLVFSRLPLVKCLLFFLSFPVCPRPVCGH